MNLSADDIQQVIAAVWQSTIDMEPVPGDWPSGVDVVSATINLYGEHEGVIQVSMGQEMAWHAARTMFDLDDSGIGPDELRDAVGELANQVGGQLKSLIPGHTRLGLPVVPAGIIAGLQDVAAATALANGMPVRVRLLAKR